MFQILLGRCARVVASTLLLSSLLTACGGGGGGGGSSPSKAPVSLESSQITSSVAYQQRGYLNLKATVTDPSAFDGAQVFLYLVDPEGLVEVGSLSVQQIDSKTYGVGFNTRWDLAPGHYQGNWQLRLCKDSACKAEFPGSPLSLSYDITVANGPLSLSSTVVDFYSDFADANTSKTFDFYVNATSTWTMSSGAGWLKVGSANGKGNTKVAVTVDTTGMAVGRYKSSVTVTGSDGQTASKPFELEVRAKTLYVDGPARSWNVVNGSDMVGLAFGIASISSSPLQWMATTSTSWLTLLGSKGQTPGTLTMMANLGSMAAGVYNGTVIVSSSGVADLVIPIQMNLSKATLTPLQSSVTLGGADGRMGFDIQSMAFALNTGNNPWPWKVTEAPEWVKLDITEGTVGPNIAWLRVSNRPELLQAGTTKGTIKIEARVAGDVVSTTVDVVAHVDPRRLLPSAWGVGFSSTPNGQVLTRNLSVRDSFGGNVGWTASSSAEWLQVTASGSTGENTSLVLRADPNGLSDKSLNEATVTLSTVVSGVAPVKVRVAFWKDATGLSAARSLPVSYSFVQADPIRPHVYVHNGGSSIDVYHAYTGEKLRSFSGLGATLASMTVEPDGSRLFAVDTANRRVAVVNLESNAAQSPWAYGGAVNSMTVPMSVRVDGVSLLLLGDGEVLREGQSLPKMMQDGGALAASADGRVLVRHVQGSSPSSTARYLMSYSMLNGGVFKLSAQGSNWSMGDAANGRDVAVSADGLTTVTASGYPYACARGNADLNLLGLLPGGDAYPNNAELLSDGRWVCGASVTSGLYDVWVYGATGLLEEKFRLGANLLDRQLVATPDGRILIGLAGGAKLVFQPLTPR